LIEPISIAVGEYEKLMKEVESEENSIELRKNKLRDKTKVLESWKFQNKGNIENNNEDFQIIIEEENKT